MIESKLEYILHKGNVMINGIRMLVLYEPVQFHSTTWAVLLLKPL
jgi:hypothetical protein